MNVKVKICGLTRRRDVDLAAELGAAYVGFVLAPASARRVTPERLAVLTVDLPRSVRRVGVFVDADAAFVREAADAGGLDVAQLYGGDTASFMRALPDLEIWRAVAVRGPDAVASFADDPAAMLVADAASGGSGSRCDWEAAAALAARRPVMLAGGLNAANVEEAVRRVRPAGVDLSSGIESAPGVKSEEKMREFFRAVKNMEAS